MNTLSTIDISKTPYVFISYSHTDSAFVQRLAADLKARGIIAWIDKPRITPGTPDWDAAIRYAIGNAKAFILIASPASRNSQFVRDELTLATDVYKCPVYPVWATGTHWVDSIPLGRGPTQYIDARASRYSLGLNELVDALNHAPPMQVRVPPPKAGPSSAYGPHTPYVQADNTLYQTGTSQPPYTGTKRNSARWVAPTCLTTIGVAIILIGVLIFVISGPISSFFSGITKSGNLPGSLPGQTQSGHLLVTPSSLHLTHTEGSNNGCFYFRGSGWTCTVTLRNDAPTGSFSWTTDITPNTITLSLSKAIVPLDAGASQETSIKIPDDFCASSGSGKVTFKGPENNIDVTIGCSD